MSAWTRLAISLYFVKNMYLPVLFLASAVVLYPVSMGNAVALLAALNVGWWVYLLVDRCEYYTGRPDRAFSANGFFMRTMREYLSVSLHRTAEVEKQLVGGGGGSGGSSGQTIFAFFPHGARAHEPRRPRRAGARLAR